MRLSSQDANRAFNTTPELAISTLIRQHHRFKITENTVYPSDWPDYMQSDARDIHEHDFESNDTNFTTTVTHTNHRGEWCRVEIEDICFKLDYTNEDGQGKVKFSVSLVIPAGRLDSREYLPREAHLWKARIVSHSAQLGSNAN